MPDTYDDLDFSNAPVDISHPVNNGSNWFPTKEQLMDFVTSPHGLIRSGGDQVIQGLHDLWNKPSADEKLGAVGDIGRGFMTTAAPIAIGASAGAPLEAAIGAGVGAGVDKGAAWLTKLLGGGPGLQNLTGAVGGAAGGVAAYQKAPSASDLWSSLLSINRGDPQVGLIRSMVPKFYEQGFGNRIEDTMGFVKDANGGKSPETVEEHGAALAKAIKTQKKAFQEHYMDPAAASGKYISGDNITAATAKAVPFLSNIEDPEGVTNLLKHTEDTYAGKNFTVGDWYKILKGKNAELRAFYDKDTGAQISDQMAGKPLAIVKAQRDAAARALYHTLDPDGEGYGPAKINKTIGDMIDIKNANERQTFKGIAERPFTPLDKYVNTAKTGINFAGKVLTGRVGMDLPDAPGASKIESTLKKSYDSIEHHPQIPKPGEAPPPPDSRYSYYPNPLTKDHIRLMPPDKPSLQPNQPSTTAEGRSKVTVEQVMKLLGAGKGQITGAP